MPSLCTCCYLLFICCIWYSSGSATISCFLAVIGCRHRSATVACSRAVISCYSYVFISVHILSLILTGYPQKWNIMCIFLCLWISVITVLWLPFFHISPTQLVINNMLLGLLPFTDIVTECPDNYCNTGNCSVVQGSYVCMWVLRPHDFVIYSQINAKHWLEFGSLHFISDAIFQ